ncbi:MAG: hypothetical protein ACKORF_00310 [Micrococcales bacterium]
MTFSNRRVQSSAIRLQTPVSKTKYLIGIGLTLCLLAVLAKVLFFSGASYLVLTQDLPAGASIAQGNFSQVQAQLGSLGGSYLTTDTRPKGFLTHPLRAGELIAHSALQARPSVGQTRVVVTSKTLVSKAIRVGSQVQVWSVKRIDNELQPPVELAENAIVAQVIKTEGVFANQNQQVELLVPSETAPLILDSVAADAAIFLVPIP